MVSDLAVFCAKYVRYNFLRTVPHSRWQECRSKLCLIEIKRFADIKKKLAEELGALK